ncbi:MAG: glycoside hydrolase family 3 C-terminal domain-containing protein [Eubacteriales bacterium]|nr:glycoside hydrolase family 3 C-terminal domain-containing protein [Eubacteriales bacterium]
MDRREVARRIAEESIVLLKNEDGLLPLPAQKKVAFFGRTQISTLYSGNGSGGANVTGCASILEECEKNGIVPEKLLKGFYQYKIGEESVSEADTFDWTKVSELVNSGVMYEIFGKYRAPLKEYEVPDTLISQAAEQTDTALIVLGRNSGGEECDRHLTEDYFLTETESRLMDTVCRHFPEVVVVLNVNGLIDLSWVENRRSLKSLLFIGIPGEEGAAALARILTGKVCPSGKMAVTVAREYEEYPSAHHFSWDKENPEKILTYEDYGLSSEANGSRGFAKSPVTVYRENIYAGYRYFDTFRKEVMIPFGYGLSYTSFQIEVGAVARARRGIEISVGVTNTGAVSGREVVQVYLSKRECQGEERPYQELKGFEKTALLEPGERQERTILIPWRELAVYRETEAAWMVEAGEYILRVGNSSRNTKISGGFAVEEDLLIEQCANRLVIAPCNQGKIEFLSRQTEGDGKAGETQRCGGEGDRIPLVIGAQDLPGEERDEPKQRIRVPDLSTEELAALCVGYGPGTPFAAVGDRSDPPTICDKEGKPLTTNSHPTGYQGYVSPAIESRGISSVFYKDGPAGIGEIAWPTEMLIACSFDRELWYLFGDAVGEECEKQKVDLWLAPAVNLHRNPLCGRNFEYFSEDPYLTGVCACEVAKGVQRNHPVLVCPKHFAVNEQETFRRGNARQNYDAVDSVLTEKAARELYLKPFEMLVREAGISCIMTSFNKINGVLAGGNRDLCTHILREEWGFEGAVVTDWGDMDVVVDGADAVAAGNDIVMPGGPPVIGQILKGVEEGRVTREELEKAVGHLLGMISKTKETRL